MNKYKLSNDLYSYYKRTVVHLNKIVGMLDHIKEYKKLDIKPKLRTDDEYINYFILKVDDQKFNYIRRKSSVDKEYKKLKKETQDLDPYGEEQWGDENIDT